jgi:hypothetical protein
MTPKSDDRPPYLEIKDWSKHQHYKDRRPPWIKLYGALLDDPDFLVLAEPAQAQLMKLWLLASRMGHPLPNDPEMLARKVNTKRLLLPALLASGFVKFCYQDASAPLAEPVQEFRPLSTENRERDREQVYNQGEKPTANRVGTLETGELIAQIQGLATTQPSGAKFIAATSVEAMGADVFRAYKAVGGSRRFTTTPPDKLSFLLREFGEALSQARAQ